MSIFSDMNEKGESIFTEKAKIIAQKFIKKIMDDLKEKILNNYNNEEFKSKYKFRNIRIIEEIDREKDEEKSGENKEGQKEEKKRRKQRRAKR